MTSHVGRLYALALALVRLLPDLGDGGGAPLVGALPRRGPTHGPRRSPRASCELRHESVVVARIVRRRWAVYRRQLRRRQQRIAAVNRANAAAARQAQLAATAAAAAPAVSAPSVRVVSLPPVTVTRTS